MSDPQPEISRYFYDLEFLETGETIDPISIGIVRAEDGAGYYAVNADVDWNGVLDHRWLPTNVVPHLPTKRLRSGRLVLDGDHPDVKPHGQIAEEVLAFLRGGHPTIELWASYGDADDQVRHRDGDRARVPDCDPDPVDGDDRVHSSTGRLHQISMSSVTTSVTFEISSREACTP